MPVREEAKRHGDDLSPSREAGAGTVVTIQAPGPFLVMPVTSYAHRRRWAFLIRGLRVATISTNSALVDRLRSRCSEVSEIPNIASATKRLRQSEKRKSLNRLRKAALKRVVKEIRLHVDAGEKSEAVSLLPRLAKAADKAAKRNTIHKNRASRIKSRWVKKVQAL